MKYLSIKASLVLIFLAATVLLVFYLLTVRWLTYLPVTLFWGAVVLMLGSIIYQIFKIELYPSYYKVVLLEIAVTCFVFHLIYQIPYYGLVGADAYRDMASAKGILLSGHVMGDPQYVTEYSYFPMVHLFGTMQSLITSIDLFSVAKWFPSLLDVTLILLLYLFVRSIFKEEKIALISALLFACLEHHILFSSLFIRETYALILAMCCVYLYFSARHSPHPATNYVLSIMCLIGTIFAHHLTSFMLLIFLAIHLLVTKASEVPFLRRVYFRNNIDGEKVSIILILIGFVTLFTYWISLTMSPFYTLVSLAMSIFNPSRWGVNTYAQIAGLGAPSIRGRIIIYGFYLFLLVFSFVLLYGLLRRGSRRIEAYSSTLFLFLCGLIGLLSIYLIPVAVIPDRFLMYGWLFGFVPLVAAILNSKNKWLKKVGVFLLIGFLLFNVYMIDPQAWDARAEKGLSTISVDEYALANRFDFSTGKIYGPQGIVFAIYDVHNNLGTTFALSEVNLTKFDWVIIYKEMLEIEKKYYQESGAEAIGPLERLVSEYSVDYNKIYESDNLLVFKMR